MFATAIIEKKNLNRYGPLHNFIIINHIKSDVLEVVGKVSTSSKSYLMYCREKYKM